MRTIAPAVLALCSWLTGAQAQDGERQPATPDLDFLEYLGAWAEDDDEWLAIEEWQKDEAAEAEAKDRKRSKSREGDDDEGN